MTEVDIALEMAHNRMTGAGTCTILSKDQIGSEIKMQSIICVVKPLELSLNSNISVSPSPEPMRAKSINVHLGDNL
jgi:hypothetical protein